MLMGQLGCGVRVMRNAHSPPSCDVGACVRPPLVPAAALRGGQRARCGDQVPCACIVAPVSHRVVAHASRSVLRRHSGLAVASARDAARHRYLLTWHQPLTTGDEARRFSALSLLFQLPKTTLRTNGCIRDDRAGQRLLRLLPSEQERLRRGPRHLRLQDVRVWRPARAGRRQRRGACAGAGTRARSAASTQAFSAVRSRTMLPAPRAARSALLCLLGPRARVCSRRPRPARVLGVRRAACAVPAGDSARKISKPSVQSQRPGRACLSAASRPRRDTDAHASRDGRSRWTVASIR